MIEKVYEISKIFDDGSPNYLKLAKFPSRNSGYAVVINLDEKAYEGLKTIEISKEKAQKILFRNTMGNQNISYAPAINLPSKEEKIERTLDKLLRFFDDDLTRNIYEILKSAKESIVNDLKAKGDLSNSILVLIIRKNGEEKFPADIEEIRQIFLKRNLSVKGKKEFNRCFLCGREVPSFPVLNEIFKFASFDKPGFTPYLSGDASGVLSICEDCRIDLEYGRRLIDEKLSFKFFGDNLWIIPSGDEKAVKRIVITFERMEKDIYSRQELRYFGKSERIIEERLKEEESLSYDFVVLHFENQAEKIMLSISEISPSRLSKIVSEGASVEKTIGIDPTLAVMRSFFKGKKASKAFYELVRCIYTGSIYSKFVLLPHIMDSLKEVFKESDILKWISIKGRNALAVYKYLKRIGVLKGGEDMDIDNYGSFFDEPWKKAVFLTGAMAAYIMRYQQRERNSTPFAKKLKGLKMRERDVKEIFKEIKAKAIQYGIEDENFNKVAEQAAENFLKAGDWKADLEELNFVFSVGMAMREKIFRRRYEDEKE